MSKKGNVIRLERMKRRITAVELGRRVGVSPFVIYNVESGRTPLIEELEEKIYDALEITEKEERLLNEIEMETEKYKRKTGGRE